MGITLLSFVVVLGVLIFFHEFGHFLIARLFGVGVEKFSLGFGPPLDRKENRKNRLSHFGHSPWRLCQDGW